jgi:transmembrane sensor
MTPSNEQIRGAIAEQANAWYVENRGGPLDREAAARFMAWLKTSRTHVEEYLGTVALAGDLKTAASMIPLEPLLARARTEAENVVTLDPPLPGPALTAPRYRGSPVLWLAAAAVLVFVAMGALWMTRDGERFGLPRTYRTAHGEQSVRVLPDGSVLNLNTDSQVKVHFSHRERVIELERGQAFFQVKHEGARAFRVSAGNVQIVDAGTQFDVYRRPDTVLVSVLEGTAAVYTGPPQLTSNGSPPAVALRLPAGYQVEVGGQVGLPRPVDAGAASAWLRKQIAFANEPLGAVADEFNRYGRIAIEIDDTALRSLPITGVFDAYDTDSFVAFLATLKDVVVQKTATRIRVFKRAPTPREPAPNAK